MSLHGNYDGQSFSDYHNEDASELTRRKNLRLRLEEQLERQRLKKEFKDDLDELSGEFDWDSLKK